ncbi:unnamed protein product [marine sediment metagenome]|uniref:Uncharacterized protein n=1 Tax=marine sediment metagenome TaxID=412755 RepID=X1B8V7_9ZZZZ
MRFRVKNEFIYKGKRKHKGTIINVSASLVNRLRKANVIEEPIKESGAEKAIINPKEKAIRSNK